MCSESGSRKSGLVRLLDRCAGDGLEGQAELTGYLPPRASVRSGATIGVARAISLALIIASAVAACGGPPPEPQQPIRAQWGSVSTRVLSSGALASVTARSLGFPKTGRLTELNVRVGDKVTPGQVLAKEDDFAYQQELARQQALLAQENAELDLLVNNLDVSNNQRALDQARHIEATTKTTVDKQQEFDRTTVHRNEVALDFAQRQVRLTRERAGDVKDYDVYCPPSAYQQGSGNPGGNLGGNPGGNPGVAPGGNPGGNPGGGSMSGGPRGGSFGSSGGHPGGGTGGGSGTPGTAGSFGGASQSGGNSGGRGSWPGRGSDDQGRGSWDNNSGQRGGHHGGGGDRGNWGGGDRGGDNRGGGGWRNSHSSYQGESGASVRPVAYLTAGPCTQARQQADSDTNSAKMAHEQAKGDETSARTAYEQSKKQRDVNLVQGKLQVDNAHQAVVQAENLVRQARTDRPSTIAAQRAVVTSQQALVAQALRDLSETTLIAPVAGTISVVNGAVGEFVNSGAGAQTSLAPGSTAQIPGVGAAATSDQSGNSTSGGLSATSPGGGAFIVLNDIDSFQVVAPFEESDAAKIQGGQKVRVTFDAIPGLTREGTVLTVAPKGVNVSGVTNYYATIMLTESDPRMRDGQTAQTAVLANAIDNVLVVPNDMVIKQDGNWYVTVPGQDGQSHLQQFQPGAIGDATTQVLSGIAFGQILLPPS